MSCLCGSGRAYGLDLELVKSPSTSMITSQTSSPSSTITESSNSPLAIATRRPRTPRKRPNQTYNEAAALLSTVYPNVFSVKHPTKPHKFTRPHQAFFEDSSDLFLPYRVFDNCGFLLHQPVPEKPNTRIESKLASFSCQSGGEIDFRANSIGLCEEYSEDFDAESILDEETEVGIDSIMGNLSTSINNNNNGGNRIPIGLGFGRNLGFGFGFGVKRGVRAFRHVDNGNWSFPTVDIHQISPRFNSNNNNGNSNSKSGKKKKKKVESKNPELAKENSANSGLLLKLNYDEVLNAWSGRGSPFSDELHPPTGTMSLYARLAQIDLFSESGGREASVLRYKEKRRTRLFSKKIRYQARKVNEDQRPRMKGRVLRRRHSGKLKKDEK
ncbi:Chloroplast import apparatus 2 putative isoform 1 [Tripterygium wilfordii]|uniref:Chloroplast import apparatus 2 putative isoform 1 n=1 Tax=Tripterygium wilfordii TaxID=458696 RepID=A0A7J7BW81_TRIWF|nr:Chloroplast import apparatus 2 putative isoform 1 [Tripterygium wilfordii]